MKTIATLLALAALAACGADGAPKPPSAAPATVTPGLTISGQAKIGVAGS